MQIKCTLVLNIDNGCQTYRFDLYSTDLESFVQPTDRPFVCILKCTDLTVFIKNN